MNSLAGVMCVGILADLGDFFEMLGPLALFGIYIFAALAKGWAKKNKQSSSEDKKQKQSFLQKAVQKHYQEIHERQTGKSRPKTPIYQPKQPKPVQRTQTPRTVREPVPSQQPNKGDLGHPVQFNKQLRQTHNRPRIRQHKQQIPVIKSQPPQPKKQSYKTAAKDSKAVKRSKAYSKNHLTAMLQQPQNLRTAIILKEILDKPLALRQ